MKPDFAPGEAEAKVKELRQHLRRAQILRAENTLREAEVVEQKAHSIGEELMRGLEKIINCRARVLPHYEDQEDARSAMRCKIWLGITDLSRSDEAQRYEKYFWVVASLRIATIIGNLRKKEQSGLICMSLDEPEIFDDVESVENRGDNLEDIRARRQFEHLLNKEVADMVLNQLSPQHRAVFFARLNGDTWEQAAQKAATSKKPQGVTPKTAAKYFDEVASDMKKALRAEDSEILATKEIKSKKPIQRQKKHLKPVTVH